MIDVMVCCKVEGLVVIFVGLTKAGALDTVVCATVIVGSKGTVVDGLVG